MSTRNPNPTPPNNNKLTPNPGNTERLKMAQILFRGIRGVEPGEPSGFTEMLAPYFGKKKANPKPTASPRVPPMEEIPPRRIEYVPREAREWVSRTQADHLYTQASLGDEQLAPSRSRQEGAQRLDLRNPTKSLRLPNFHGLWYLYAIVAVVVLFVAANAVIAISVFTGDLVTSIKYGNPRTTHLEAFVGFNGETSASPTEITAINLHGIATMYVLPAGRAEGGFILQEPLAEDPEGKSPIFLDLFDCDRDGHADLIVSLSGGASFVYLLDTGRQQFRAPTPDEQSRLILPALSH